MDAKFAGQTPPNDPNDPRRLTIGLNARLVFKLQINLKQRFWAWPVDHRDSGRPARLVFSEKTIFYFLSRFFISQKCWNSTRKGMYKHFLRRCSAQLCSQPAKHQFAGHGPFPFFYVMILLYIILQIFYTHNLGSNLMRLPEHPWIKWESTNSSSWRRFSRDIAYSIVARTLSKPP